MSAADRRRKKLAAVDRNTAQNSLLAARQLYGRDAATTSTRSDVFCGVSTATLNGNPSERSMGQDSPPFRDQQGGKDQLGATKRRKRARTYGLDAEAEASSGWGNQVASKAAPHLTALQLEGDKLPGCISSSSIGVAGGSKAQLQENTNGCNTPQGGMPVACSLTPETSKCVARANPKHGRRRETRDRKRKKVTGLKPVGPVHAIKRSLKQVPGALNGVSSLSQRELNRQMRLLTPGEQGEINRALQTFAAQIDGKSMRTRDFFNLVSDTVWCKKCRRATVVCGWYWKLR